mmetsp:Transcript_5982/g.18397  ORF Transcript_5982/g.18397 Transcript_5982/m.18397 type:complete len:283 (-) Transcript_5982:499-1347(-)
MRGLFSKPPPPPPPVVPSLTLWEAFNDPWVQQWAFGLLALQAVLMVVLSIIPSPMSEDVGVAAHQLTIAVPFAYAAYHGARLWFFDEAFAAMGTSAHGRLYAASEDCFSLTRFMFGMQVFDLMVTFIVPSMRKLEHLVHHGLTLATALCGLSGPYLMYQAGFFFGLVEISSVPLVFVDLFRKYPALHEKSKIGDALNEFVRLSFAVTFLLIRCVMWPVVVMQLVLDLISVYRAGQLQGGFQMMIFGCTCSVLTFLQLYWGYKVVAATVKMLKGDRSDREKEA